MHSASIAATLPNNQRRQMRALKNRRPSNKRNNISLALLWRHLYCRPSGRSIVPAALAFLTARVIFNVGG